MISPARCAWCSRVNHHLRYSNGVEGSKASRYRIGPHQTCLCGSQANGCHFKNLQLNATLLRVVWLIVKYSSHHLLGQVLPD